MVELQTANVAYFQRKIQFSGFSVTVELRTANVAHFQRKIQFPGFSAYLDGSPSQLIQISGVVLYSRHATASCVARSGLDMSEGFDFRNDLVLL